jgi:hypothetical protein
MDVDSFTLGAVPCACADATEIRAENATLTSAIAEYLLEIIQSLLRKIFASFGRGGSSTGA